MRLRRAHDSGPHAHLDQSAPRLVPAMLLEAQAHAHLAAAAARTYDGLHEGDDARPDQRAVLEATRDAADSHREQARALLAALRQPPYEPAQSRVHRVRLAEKREAERVRAKTEEPPRRLASTLRTKTTPRRTNSLRSVFAKYTITRPAP